MRKDLKPADLGDFLAGTDLAVLTTYRKDGSVLLSPVWYEWADDGFNVFVFDGDIKLTHLARDLRASVLVAEDKPPYRGIQLDAEARVSSPSDARDGTRRLAVRYLGEETGNKFADAYQSYETKLVRMEPGRTRIWDFSDEL